MKTLRFHLTISFLQTNADNFAKSADPDEMARNLWLKLCGKKAKRL